MCQILLQFSYCVVLPVMPHAGTGMGSARTSDSINCDV